jgi:L-threonylcarbamoyladenylate synthase
MSSRRESSGGGEGPGAAAPTPLGPEDAVRLQECVTSGGVAVFPSDTVYGVCCDPENGAAARRLYELKGRPALRPAAVMFFALEAALAALSELTQAERVALRALLPGPVTLLLPNRGGRFAPACAPLPAGDTQDMRGGQLATLGLRVPRLPDAIKALGAVATPVLQSSANISGEPDARRLRDVPRRLREGADLVLDGGELPGTPSTVIDLRGYERSGEWSVRREGALPASTVARLLGAAR